MIKLAEPTAGYAKEIMELRQELLDEDPNVYIHGGGDLERYQSAKEWICHVENMRRRETCPEHLVDSDIYLAIREEDDRVLGIVELRHHIDHPVLREWGGHIGYCIRLSERRKGYARAVLTKALEIYKARGIHEVLLTCGEGNLASERTILGGGGVYEKTVWAEPLKMNMKRFWIMIP